MIILILLSPNLGTIVSINKEIQKYWVKKIFTLLVLFFFLLLFFPRGIPRYSFVWNLWIKWVQKNWKQINSKLLDVCIELISGAYADALCGLTQKLYFNWLLLQIFRQHMVRYPVHEKNLMFHLIKKFRQFVHKYPDVILLNLTQIKKKFIFYLQKIKHAEHLIDYFIRKFYKPNHKF